MIIIRTDIAHEHQVAIRRQECLLLDKVSSGILTWDEAVSALDTWLQKLEAELHIKLYFLYSFLKRVYSKLTD